MGRAMFILSVKFSTKKYATIPGYLGVVGLAEKDWNLRYGG